jgi:hypothetical protein
LLAKDVPGGRISKNEAYLLAPSLDASENLRGFLRSGLVEVAFLKFVAQTCAQKAMF